MRIPASLCNLTGLKTNGAVYGEAPLIGRPLVAASAGDEPAKIIGAFSASSETLCRTAFWTQLSFRPRWRVIPAMYAAASLVIFSRRSTHSRMRTSTAASITAQFRGNRFAIALDTYFSIWRITALTTAGK